MIQFNLTPASGVMILNGKYIYDKSTSDDEYNQEIAEFQLELSWGSDMLMGTRITRIVWLDTVKKGNIQEIEQEIIDAYYKLSKEPSVSIKDKNTEL
jgi:hypothetical protein